MLSTSVSLDSFKDKCGRWRSRSLFIEFAHPDYPAYFTLDDDDKTVDGVTYISAKRKYLEYKDPYEHTFATAVFGSYPCWDACCSSPDLRDHIESWREELQLLLRSIGVSQLVRKAESGDVAAAKHLASFSTRQKGNRPAGRPRKTGDEEALAKSAAADHSEAWGRLVGSDLVPKEVN